MAGFCLFAAPGPPSSARRRGRVAAAAAASSESQHAPAAEKRHELSPSPRRRVDKLEPRRCGVVSWPFLGSDRRPPVPPGGAAEARPGGSAAEPGAHHQACDPARRRARDHEPAHGRPHRRRVVVLYVRVSPVDGDCFATKNLCDQRGHSSVASKESLRVLFCRVPRDLQTRGGLPRRGAAARPGVAARGKRSSPRAPRARGAESTPRPSVRRATTRLTNLAIATRAQASWPTARWRRRPAR